MIATPKLYVDDIRTLTLTFWSRMTTTGGQVIVGVMDDVEDINSFVPVDTIVRVSGSWTEQKVDLSSYEGTGKYIAFSSFRNASSNAVYLDDVLITDTTVTCAMPESLIALDIQDTKATVRWNDPASAEYYNLKTSTYSILPDMEDGDGLVADSLIDRYYELTELQPVIGPALRLPRVAHR